MYILSTDHIHDAISELEGIQSHPDMALCSVIALLYAHKCCDIIGECAAVLGGLGPWGRKGHCRDIAPPPPRAIEEGVCTGDLNLLLASQDGLSLILTAQASEKTRCLKPPERKQAESMTEGVTH